MMLKDGAGPILAVQPFHATCFYFEGQTASFGVERPRCEGLSPEESTIPKGFAGEERDGRPLSKRIRRERLHVRCRVASAPNITRVKSAIVGRRALLALSQSEGLHDPDADRWFCYGTRSERRRLRNSVASD